MCGFTGWLAHERDLIREHDAIAAMTETTTCRGPDESGTWVRPSIALGHRRLRSSISPGGEQLMTVDTPRSSVALVISGEIYNFLELRALLEAHCHRFRADSDTEVLLRGFLKWGDDAVSGDASRVPIRGRTTRRTSPWFARRRRSLLMTGRPGSSPWCRGTGCKVQRRDTADPAASVRRHSSECWIRITGSRSIVRLSRSRACIERRSCVRV